MSLNCYPLEEDPSQSFLALLPADDDAASSNVLHLKGKVRLRVLAPENGIVRCLGWTIRPSSSGGGDDGDCTDIFSPKGFSLMEIRASLEVGGGGGFKAKKQKDDKGFFQGLSLKKEVKSDVVSRLKAGNVVCVLFSRLNLDWCSTLERQVVYLDKLSFFGRDAMIANNLSVPSFCPSLETSLDVNLFAGFPNVGLRYLEESPDWDTWFRDTLLNSKTKGRARVLAMGGKGVGKSTFLRYLSNRILSETTDPSVLYIDLDPGQAEFTVPGCVSVSVVDKALLGPNFCHVDQKQRLTLFVGEVNMSNCKTRYLDCLSRLADFCHADPELSSLPWVINSMGFTKGLGLVFVQRTVELFRPTTVISITSRFPAKNFPPDFERGLNCRLVRLNAVPESKTALRMGSNDLWGHPEPRKLRDLVILSHFAHVPADARPKQVSWDDVTLQALFEDDARQQLLHLLNGSLVSLTHISDSEAQSATRIGNGLRVVPSSVVGESLDFGIVMSVDVTERTFTVLSTLGIDELEAVNCLSIGAIRLPTALLCSQYSEQKPYLSGRRTDNPLSETWHRSSKPKGNAQLNE